jgi:hypothetical protein
MTFKAKIANLRKGASEAQSASKIIDKLKALKDNNNPNSSYRWIWELIQNAKDVVNASGLVDIEIKFSESNKTRGLLPQWTAVHNRKYRVFD